MFCPVLNMQLHVVCQRGTKTHSMINKTTEVIPKLICTQNSFPFVPLYQLLLNKHLRKTLLEHNYQQISQIKSQDMTDPSDRTTLKQILRYRTN